MQESANYTAEEEGAIRAGWQTGTLPDCPRCAVRMHHKAMGGGSFGLGYSRRREWLLCPQCRRSVLFDARRGTRN